MMVSKHIERDKKKPISSIVLVVRIFLEKSKIPVSEFSELAQASENPQKMIEALNLLMERGLIKVSQKIRSHPGVRGGSWVAYYQLTAPNLKPIFYLGFET